MASNTFNQLTVPSIITEVALHLFAGDDDSVEKLNERGTGTCVVIATWLALTARHVIEDWARTLVPVRAIREHEAGTSGTAYSVVGVAMARWTDLALLRLQPWSDLPAEHNWDNCARLSLRPPAIGSRVYFDTTARFDGGMSGGPVFDESGHLVGIISSSFDGTDDDGDYFSSATLLWPLMGVRLDFPRADAAPGTSYSVLDLADAGLIHVEGRDLVSVERGDEPDTIQIRFHWPG